VERLIPARAVAIPMHDHTVSIDIFDLNVVIKKTIDNEGENLTEIFSVVFLEFDLNLMFFYFTGVEPKFECPVCHKKSKHR
jgi:hypothetical protein